MFSQEETDAYKKITAPPQLKGRILEAHRRQAVPNSFHFTWRRALAAVSLLVFLCGAALTYGLWSQDSIEVSMSGRRLTSSGLDLSELPAQASAGRSLGSLDLAFDLNSRHPLMIHVTEGELKAANSENPGITDRGSSLETEGKTAVIWTLDPDRSRLYTLQIQGRQSSVVIHLVYDDEASSWFIREDSQAETP